ncbi:NADP-dependent oxidoreductase domain-containing protein [Caenorhabditis elegans]|uniref:NADP-dependent oxidoreductase domain-containing protein n=1 Tax=Caenorhabditis elegans TaxID=6239 RepID=Q9U2J5_CAEEL|nr:NADP-dependent oxidoreductase domain-containing protein [Caenorhabditis elegans]CAB60336.1 NADP-dependent oxidoreductase domain-containing protein [Caenorhabditis elegans]|eukprot:NP_496926.1 Uncharacterized protein CELE_Y39G8B.2 [Caenorhabditis elegans]
MPIADTVTLNSGYEMPVIGYGTWQLPKNLAAERVRDALEAGYRHIDSALSFKNQEEVAAGIKDWCKIRKVRREELFLSSKIWNTYHSRNRCMQQIDEMLEIFETTYMDLIVIHWPFGWAEDEPPGERGLWPRGANGKMRYSDVDYLETWKALEDAHRSGKIRSIGLANFNIGQVEQVWTKGLIKPAVLQVEMNPFLDQEEIRQFCREKGIILTAFMLTGNPGSALYRKHEDPNLLYNETLQSIAKGHGKSVVQVLVRWAIDLRTTALVKSSESKRIRQNINIFKFRLTSQEIARIKALNIDFRILNPLLGNYDHPYFPWPHVQEEQLPQKVEEPDPENL